MQPHNIFPVDAATPVETNVPPAGSHPETDGVLHLPPALGLTAAEALHRALQDWIERDGAVILDGSDVERVSTPCLQLLVAAAASARSQGLAFRIVTPSTVLDNAVCDLGLGQALGMETP